MIKLLLILIISFSILPSLLSQTNKTSGYPEYRNDSCYFDDGGCQYLLALDSDNIWQVANPLKPIFIDALSSPNVLITDSINPYKKNLNDFVQFDIPLTLGFGDNDLFIQFWHKFQFDSLNDGGVITASIDTFDFKNIVMLQDNPFDYNISYLEFNGYKYTTDNIFGSDTGYTGSNENWSYTEIHIGIEFWVRLGKISEYDDTFHLRFNIISDSIITGDAGWAIDNIVFGGYYGSDIDNNEPAVLLKTYPNPATDMVYIYAAGSQNVPLTILIADIHGRPVKQVKDVYTSDGNINLNIENIPSGIYTVHIQSDNKKYFGRLIKQ